jgi:hypothetical protein
MRAELRRNRTFRTRLLHVRAIRRTRVRASRNVACTCFFHAGISRVNWRKNCQIVN